MIHINFQENLQNLKRASRWILSYKNIFNHTSQKYIIPSVVLLYTYSKYNKH